jgi:hypothetical protein
MQRSMHKRQQQPKRKANHKQCCLQCCRIKTTNRSNKANMYAMMERMKVLMAGGGTRWKTQQDEEYTPPGGNMLPPKGQTHPRNPGNERPSAPIPKCLSSTTQTIVTNLRQTRTNAGRAGSLSMPLLDKCRGPPQ